VPKPVTPAKAGVQKYPKSLDPGLRRDDKIGKNSTFYEFIEHRTLNIELLYAFGGQLYKNCFVHYNQLKTAPSRGKSKPGPRANPSSHRGYAGQEDAA
jgi:hypothetical protein